MTPHKGINKSSSVQLRSFFVGDSRLEQPPSVTLSKHVHFQLHHVEGATAFGVEL